MNSPTPRHVRRSSRRLRTSRAMGALITASVSVALVGSSAMVQAFATEDGQSGTPQQEAVTPIEGAANPDGRLGVADAAPSIAVVVDTSKAAEHRREQWGSFLSQAADAVSRTEGARLVAVDGVNVLDAAKGAGALAVENAVDNPNWGSGLATAISQQKEDAPFSDVIVLASNPLESVDMNVAVTNANVLKEHGAHVRMFAAGDVPDGDLHRIAATPVPDAAIPDVARGDLSEPLKAVLADLEAKAAPKADVPEEPAEEAESGEAAESGDGPQSGEAAQSGEEPQSATAVLNGRQAVQNLDDEDIDLELLEGSEQPEKKVFTDRIPGTPCMTYAPNQTTGKKDRVGVWDESGMYCMPNANNGLGQRLEAFVAFSRIGVVRDGLGKWNVDGWHRDENGNDVFKYKDLTKPSQIQLVRPSGFDLGDNKTINASLPYIVVDQASAAWPGRWSLRLNTTDSGTVMGLDTAIDQFDTRSTRHRRRRSWRPPTRGRNSSSRRRIPRRSRRLRSSSSR